jgi:hypothetical protein
VVLRLRLLSDRRLLVVVLRRLVMLRLVSDGLGVLVVLRRLLRLVVISVRVVMLLRLLRLLLRRRSIVSVGLVVVSGDLSVVGLVTTTRLGMEEEE